MSSADAVSGSGSTLIPLTPSELKSRRASFNAVAGLDELRRTRTSRALGFAGAPVEIGFDAEPGSVEPAVTIEMPVSFAFTTIRSATLCSNGSAESYPNTNFGDGVICDHSSLARWLSGVVENRNDVPVDHCGSNPPVGSPTFCKMKVTIEARSMDSERA